MTVLHDEQNPLPDATHSPLDLEALAEIILEMMRRELRLEAERMGK